MQKYRVETSAPSKHKGTGPIYQIHDADGPIRQLCWDYEPIAKVICEDLNDGRALLAEVHYKLHNEQYDLSVPAHFEPDEDIVYFLEADRLEQHLQNASTTEEKRSILLREGYSEISISWRTLPTFE